MKNMHNIRMHIFIFIFILMVAILLFFVFSYPKSNQHKNLSKIVVYKISRETFFSFLESPSIGMLNSKETNKCIYSQSGQWHITSGVKRFIIDQSLLDFVGDESEIKKYLLQYGVNDEVINTFVLDAPNVPLTLWIETSKADFFITIEKQEIDYSYDYEYFTLSDYRDKYYWNYASLMVNDKEIQSSVSSKIYSDYAEVPLMLVLKSLGATITTSANEQLEISFKGKKYVLDIEERNLYEIGRESTNLLHKDGGVTFVYPYESELMIDTFTLNTVLRQMGEDVIITCDKTNKIGRQGTVSVKTVGNQGTVL